jgi:hypothetical protein
MTFDPAPRPAPERLEGAAIAHMLITRAAEGGHSAARIEAWQEELLGQMAPDGARTPAGSEWLVGFRDEAAGTLATLRDVERSDASEQFERDATAAKELRLRDERELEAG